MPRRLDPGSGPASGAATAAADRAAAYFLHKEEAAVAALQRRRDAARAAADALDAHVAQAELDLAATRRAATRAVARESAGGRATLTPAAHLSDVPNDVVLELASLLDYRSRLAGRSRRLRRHQRAAAAPAPRRTRARQTRRRGPVV